MGDRIRRTFRRRLERPSKAESEPFSRGFVFKLGAPNIFSDPSLSTMR